MIPCQQRFAEKIRAYPLPSDVANSRVKGLLDLALLVGSGGLDSQRRRDAWGLSLSEGATHDLPMALVPPADWQTPFEALAAGSPPIPPTLFEPQPQRCFSMPEWTSPRFRSFSAIGISRPRRFMTSGDGQLRRVRHTMSRSEGLSVNDDRSSLQRAVVDPVFWTKKKPFLRWWAALKMKESQCLKYARVTHRV